MKLPYLQVAHNRVVTLWAIPILGHAKPPYLVLGPPQNGTAALVPFVLEFRGSSPNVVGEPL